MSRPRDYSSQSYSPSGTGASKGVPTANKSREKDDMVGLNDKFVQLIDKVCINMMIIIIIILLLLLLLLLYYHLKYTLFYIYLL